MKENVKSSLKYYAGIDIGSTSAKLIVIDNTKNIIYKSVRPTGWSSLETANIIKNDLDRLKFNNIKIVSTGYGRVSVPYADKSVTEITCHGLGASELFHKKDLTVIDVGGQDTKVIKVKDGQIIDFSMNDKCSAGTGRFLEIMANTLGVDILSMCELAKKGKDIQISSICTVFAESEVVGLIGKGESKENIAFGVINSIVKKIAGQIKELNSETICLTGGLCEVEYVINSISTEINRDVITSSNARYAGAYGAAIKAMEI